MLSQHAEELGRTGTVLEACQRATGLKPNETRALLGRFLFGGEAAEKPLDGLSGGERRRLSLAILVQSGANVLILDEPTNHLDLESREALEAALQGFPGALLLISHDRALLDAVGTRTIAIEDRTLHSYVGGWPEYVRVREERAEAEREAKARAKAEAEAEGRRRPTPPRPSKNQRAPGAPARVRDRAGRGRAGGARARAGRPAGLERPAQRRRSRRRRHADAKARVEALYAELETVSGLSARRVVLARPVTGPRPEANGKGGATGRGPAPSALERAWLTIGSPWMRPPTRRVSPRAPMSRIR